MFSQPAPAPMRAWSSRAFTLTEVLMVVVIIGIAAAIVIPNAINTSDLQVMSAARMVTADLQYAQDTAITTQTSVSVIFQATAERYRLRNTSGDLIHPITKETFSVDFTSLRGFGEVDMISASFNGSPWVTFDELGTPNAGGSVVLRAGPHVYTISVAAVTGMVTVTRS